jgi:hypothetical protein
MGCRRRLEAGGVCLYCGRLDAPEDAIAGRLLLVDLQGEQAPGSKGSRELLWGSINA